MNISFFIVTSAALLDSINPCAISVLLLTIGFLLSLGKIRKQILFIGLTYIFGLYITYLFIGLGMLQALTFLGFPHVLAKIGASILFATGAINLLGYAFPKFPIKLRMPQKSHSVIAYYIDKATYLSAFVLGLLVALFEFPCTGGPYLSILSLLHDNETFSTGLLYLLYYKFFFVLLLLVFFFLASTKIVLGKVESWRKTYTKRVDIVSSSLMVLLSIVIFLTS